MNNWYIRSWKQQILLFTVTFVISGWFTAMMGPERWIDSFRTQDDSEEMCSIDPPLEAQMCLEKILDPKDSPG